MTSPPMVGGMSSAPPAAVNQALDRTERVQRVAAVLLTVLLHALLVLFLTLPPTPITMTAPQGRADGRAMEVTLLDERFSQPPPSPEPMHRKPAPKRPKRSRAIAPSPPTPVVQATIPMPPKADASDSPTVLPINEPEPPDPAEQPVHGFGPRPGLVSNDNARANAALAAKLGRSRRHSNTPAPVGTNMGTDGFQVYYDLADEDRLRAWRDQGITELFLPMPGTWRRMVCPLEVALRRGSGECRMVEMDSPELKFIGDAREVINIQRVYRRGEEVWSGPGPYR
ncbi:MAG TPA: type II toxin-antitoxin system RelE/ParE family toxin [Dokdonella sp.]|uniref:type II toxin-antitoxin system RelE/ParE family toxin n=1 Tax=Dokdonella sp. TaxID=2291710 RepID=UPI002D80B78B|nr:type II toxin-antitoxin system RelE/ParE family toxin [Dokdonella sp.]HET9031466.1 type II toxin-antitoxin system RelE/ParE family toxin [Dokdonella sp.]